MGSAWITNLILKRPTHPLPAPISANTPRAVGDPAADGNDGDVVPGPLLSRHPSELALLPEREHGDKLFFRL